MTTVKPTKLIDLLELSFEKPLTGTVNLRLLYSLVKGLIVGLKLDDLVVDVEPPAEKDATEEETESTKDGSQRPTRDPTSQKDPKTQVKIAGSEDGVGSEESTASSSSGTSSSTLQGSGSITIGSGSESADNGTSTSDLLGSGDSREQALPQLTEITNLLRAYLVRLQALENDVASLKASRTETLEMLNKVLDQIAQLEARLCEEQKKVAKLASDLACLSLIVSQYETHFEDLDRGLDKLDAQIQGVKCNIRCIEKEREKFMEAVRTVTDQINYVSSIKADKVEVEAELVLRAYATDLNRYVPYDCFNVIQVDAARSIALMHEEIYSQNKWIRYKLYELEKIDVTKAELIDLENVKKDVVKILQDLRRIEQKNLKIKNKPPGSAAGVSRATSRPSSCLACGDHANLDDCGDLVPHVKPLIPFGKAKDIFTINRRYVGGAHTKIGPEERRAKSAVPFVPCKGPMKIVEFKQIIGSDGACYLADPDLQKE